MKYHPESDTYCLDDKDNLIESLQDQIKQLEQEGEKARKKLDKFRITLLERNGEVKQLEQALDKIEKIANMPLAWDSAFNTILNTIKQAREK